MIHKAYAVSGVLYCDSKATLETGDAINPTSRTYDGNLRASSPQENLSLWMDWNYDDTKV